MKYLTYIIWMIFTLVMCLTMLPALFFGKQWFDIGDKILEYNWDNNDRKRIYTIRTCFKVKATWV